MESKRILPLERFRSGRLFRQEVEKGVKDIKCVLAKRDGITQKEVQLQKEKLMPLRCQTAHMYVKAQHTFLMMREQEQPLGSY